jgi:hypothetical protein
MAVTFITGTNKAINAFDKDAQSVTYTLKDQPGTQFVTGNATSNVSLLNSTVTGVSKLAGVFAVNSSGTINVYSASLTDVTNSTEYYINTSFNNGVTGWIASGDTGTQITATFVDGQGDNYVQMSASGGQYQGLYQAPALTANRKYRFTVDAQIPIGATLRLDSRHFGVNNTGAPQEGFFKDFQGDGIRKTLTFDFYPTDTVTIDPAGLPNRSINGGYGSVDYGVNRTSSNTDTAPNRRYHDHPVKVEAVDTEGNTTEATFVIRAELPWTHIANLTHGYVCGGYIGAESWRHVCKMDYSTDSSVSLGTKMADNGVTTPNANRSGARYTDGSTDIWTGNGICYSSYAYAESSYTENFNMITETAYGLNNQHNGNHYGQQGASDYERRMGYSHAGSLNDTSTGTSQCEKFNMSTTTRVGDIGQATAWVLHGGGFTQTHMFFAQAGSGTRDYYDFATETRVGNGWTNNTEFTGGAAHTKAISMWDNRGWFVGWNTVVNTYIINFTTGVMTRAGDQTTNNGEANCLTAMNHGYTCGAYNGAQNNHSDKFNFSNGTVARNAAGDNKGSPGASSGVAMWAEL